MNKGKPAKHKNKPIIKDSDFEDEIVIVIDDPRLTDDQKRSLYKIGTKLYGKPNFDIEELILRKPRDIEEVCSEVESFKDSYLRLKNAKKRADVIIAALQDYDPDNFSVMLKLDRFIQNNPIDIYVLTHIIGYTNKSSATARARFNAALRHANDPKQQEKSFIYSCWQGWQEKPDSYKSKAAFARDMLTKCEKLKSQKKIEDWCREWEKANPAG